MKIIRHIYHSPDLSGIKLFAQIQAMRLGQCKESYFLLFQAANGGDQLEIYSAREWRRSRWHFRGRQLIGIATSFGQAQKLVVQMVDKSLREGKRGDLRYLFGEENL